jgi:hypothetical protein
MVGKGQQKRWCTCHILLLLQGIRKTSALFVSVESFIADKSAGLSTTTTAKSPKTLGMRVSLPVLARR